MDNLFNIEVARFQLDTENRYVLQGWFNENEIGRCEFLVSFDGSYLPVSVTHREGIEIRKKYLRLKNNLDHEYYVWIDLPPKAIEAKMLTVFLVCDKERKKIWHITGKNLAKQRNMVDSYIENFSQLEDKRLSISGWAASINEISFQVKDQNNQPVKAEVKRTYRRDVAYNYPERELNEELGFACIFPAEGLSKITLTIQSQQKKTSYTYSVQTALNGKGLNAGPNYWVKAVAYFKRNGVGKTVKRAFEKVLKKDLNSIDYDKWLKKHLPDEEELKKQRRMKFSIQPKFSIVVPLFKTPEKYLRELIQSVENQTYGNWELCLSDGSGANSPLDGMLREAEKKNANIRVIRNEEALRISENTNRAIEAATGDYIVFADHDDMLSPHALFECAKAINEHADCDMLYSDEDKVSMDGNHYFQPHFKPDYNPDLLCCMNYFCHLVVVKKSLLMQAGALDAAYDGAQDYDFVLRCTEKANRIVHIPKILYHWRAHLNSTAENPESKQYAFEAGRRAISAHYDRMKIDAEVVQGEYLGLYRSLYRIKERPLISIVIPNKDHIEDLDKCISSILERSTYDNYEFIIVENNSTEESTFSYYKQLEDTYENIRVIYWEDAFNYSQINNFGVKHAKGEYILLLNNDTEIINNNCLEEMLGYCMRPDVGIVGARLYFEDDVIQHAGVVIGFGGMAGHVFIGSKRGDNGYFSRIICASDYSAVTAACMMVKKSVFLEAGGLNPDFQVAFNDIDFCLKVRKLGYLVVYNPYAELYHYESKSRGQEDTPEKVARFNKETDLLLERWPDLVKNGDPYYNPNLSLDKADMSLKVL